MVSSSDPPSSSAHRAFPTAADMGFVSMASSAGTSPSPPPSGPTAPAAASSYHSPLPSSPAELLDAITRTPAEEAGFLLPILNGLADGPLLSLASPSAAAASPAADGSGGSGAGASASSGKQPRAPPVPRGVQILSLPNAALPTDNAQVRAMTLGLTFVVTTRLNRPVPQNRNPLEMLDYAARLAHVGDPAQFAMAPGRVAEFAWSILRFGQKYNVANLATTVLPALLALLERTSFGAFFNPVHAVYLEASLLTGNFEAAYNSLTRVLYTDAYDDTTYLDVLTYHHHAGTITAVMGKFAEATEYFDFATSMFTQAASAIQLACAKRAVLCELLATGKEHKPPADMASSVSRLVSKGMPEYTKLAKAFDNGDWKAVREAAVAGEEVFAMDANRGLVAQILNSVTKRRILVARKTYSRLTLDDLARKAGGDDDEGVAAVKRTVEAMVESGEIRADISTGSPAIVTFSTTDADYASPAVMAQLAEAQRMAAWMQGELVRGNRRLGLSSKWLVKQARAMDARDRAPVGGDEKRGGFDDGIGGVPAVRGVGSRLDDMGF